MSSICNNPGDCEYLEERGDSMNIDLNQNSIFFDEYENHVVVANNTTMNNVRAMHIMHHDDGIHVEFVCRHPNASRGTHVTVHNVRKCMHVPAQQIIHGNTDAMYLIKERKPMNLTQVVKEHDGIFLHGGRHNNVMADDTFMNDIREMHMTRRNGKTNITFTCQQYPDDQPEYVTIHDVKDVRVKSVYWSNAGFNWED
jgi:hypothetical protein